MILFLRQSKIEMPEALFIYNIRSKTQFSYCECHHYLVLARFECTTTMMNRNISLAMLLKIENYLD